jgi:chemotaxis protein histidine kinase CheA
MDVVKKNVSRLSGMIDIETEIGVGTRFTLTLPITLAIIKALIVEAAGQVFAIPLNAVLEILQVATVRTWSVETREVIAIREDTCPLLRLTRAFNLSGEQRFGSFYVILVGLRSAVSGSWWKVSRTSRIGSNRSEAAGGDPRHCRRHQLGDKREWCSSWTWNRS